MTGSALHIAIVGLAIRCPGALTEAEFWQNLADGVESVRSFRPDEVELPESMKQLGAGAVHVPAGGVLDEATRFDAARFGFSAREAEITDPQQRQFLEVACEAFENAGIDHRDRGSTGVFAGASFPSYLLARVWDSGSLATVGQYPLVVGNDKDHVATRTAYHLDLRGPAVAVQSACSTSLMAVHLACQSLLSGECDTALAGASAVGFPQHRGYHHVEGGILSPDGHCRPFSVDASGTVPASGVAAVVLKRLADAQRDGDPIRAVIRATSVGNDGARKLSYAAPAVHGQSAVIAEALSLADLSPADISYVEAHGTGTPLGDPIEAAALMAAMPWSGDPADRCWLGSVKSNIGHLDVAAGMAGLIKTVLALEAELIPASLHAEPVNPALRLETGRFEVATKPVSWPRNGRPRCAGVSSFGLGGTNVHVVLAEAPDDASAVPPANDGGPEALLLSADTEVALARLGERLARYLDERPDTDLARLSGSLRAGRRSGPVRRAVVAHSTREAHAELSAPGSGRRASAPRIGLCFTGAAGYPVQAVRQLLDLPAFADAFAQVEEAFAALGQPLLPLDELAGTDDPRLDAPTGSLPLLFALQVGLAALLRGYGVEPATIGGHSVGEYAAACVAGILDLPEAARMIRRRSELFEAAPPGRMVSVDTDAEHAAVLADEFGVSVAVVNAADNCVLSGDPDRIERLAARASDAGLRVRRVQVATAAHSYLLDDAAARLTEFAGGIALHEAGVPYFSGAKGRAVRPGEVTRPSYWGGHMRDTVRFADLSRAMSDVVDVVIEIGPAGTLAPHLRRDGHFAPDAVYSCVPHHADPTAAATVLFRLLADLWERGTEVAWPDRTHGRGRLALPPTPFAGDEYVLERSASPAAEVPATRPAEQSLGYVPQWHRQSSRPAPDAPAAGTWVVFDDGSDLADRTARALVERGAGVRRVHLAEHLPLVGTDALGRAVHAALDATDLSGVLYFWGAAGGGDPSDDARRVELAFAVPMAVAVDLGHRDSCDVRYVAVVRDLMDVTGAETADPYRALTLGPVLVAGREHPHLSTAVVDVGTADPPVGALVGEILDRDGEEEVVAFRGRYRWLRRWIPTPLPAPTAAAGLAEGAVLITGGLGGIGLAVAEHLVGAGVRHIALLGRRPVPERSHWDALCREAPDSRLAAAIPVIRRMEAAGATVLPLAADVADEPALAAAVAEAAGMAAPLHTVIHAAGVAGGGLLALRSREDWTAVLAPKVRGTTTLARALRGTPVRRVLLCSALDAVLGTLGQVDHVAANAFLDVVPRTGWFGEAEVTAVNWGAWREVGQAADLSGLGELTDWRRTMLEHALAPEIGAAATLAALGAGWSSLAVSAVDPTVLLRQARTTDVVSLMSDAAPPTARSARRRRPLPAHTFRAPDDPVSDVVASVWADVLGVQEVGLDDDYFALGGNSLLAMQLVARLRRLFSFPMPLSAIIERPTVDAQAQWLRQSLDAYLDSLSDEEVARQLAVLDTAAGRADAGASDG